MASGNDIRKIAKYTRNQLFGVGSLTDDIRAQWDSAIADFQAKRVALDDAEQQLYAAHDAALASDDYDGWGIAFNKVQNAKARMDAIAGAVSGAADYWAGAKNSAAEWYQDFSGSSDVDPNTYSGILYGLTGTRSVKKARGMGFAPLAAVPISMVVVIGVIATAVAALSAAASYISYLSVGGKGKSPLSQISDSFMWIAFGLAAVFVLPKLIGNK